MSNKHNICISFPLKPYKITFKNRVLDELGELSHYILRSLCQFSLTFDQIEMITQLSKFQLEPVVERLEALDFLADGKLTPQGYRIAQLLCNNIHNKSVEVLIDSHYHSDYRDEDMLIVEAKSDAVHELTSAYLAPTAKGVAYSAQEDKYQQKHRLERRLKALFNIFIPELAQEEFAQKTWRAAWNIEIEHTKLATNKGIYVHLPFQSGLNQAPSEKKAPSLKIKTPVLSLQVSAQMPKGIDWQDKSLENVQHFHYSFTDETIYQQMPLLIEHTDFQEYKFASVAKDELAQMLLEDTQHSYEKEIRFLSREFAFTEQWQGHVYDYVDILKHINDEKIHRVTHENS